MKTNQQASRAQGEQLVCQIIRANLELMKLLKIVANLNLNQGVIAAGSIRNTVWQTLCHRPVQLQSDIDVVFFDPDRPYADNLVLQKQLQTRYPQYQWQVKNEVYMNTHNFAGAAAYTSVADAIGHFVETPTCVGAFLDDKQRLNLIDPHGVEDLVNFICRPIPFYQQDADHMAIFKQRMADKQWQTQWPRLTILSH